MSLSGVLKAATRETDAPEPRRRRSRIGRQGRDCLPVWRPRAGGRRTTLFLGVLVASHFVLALPSELAGALALLFQYAAHRRPPSKL